LRSGYTIQPLHGARRGAQSFFTVAKTRVPVNGHSLPAAQLPTRVDNPPTQRKKHHGQAVSHSRSIASTLQGGSSMAIRLGDIAPDFTANTTQGPIKFHEWIGDHWCVLFSHPKDFTPVCTTELGETARLKPEFDKRNVKVIGLSVDPADSHTKWAADIKETQGHALNFPVIADSDRKVSDLYDMIHPNANDTLTVRSVFIIDPKKKVRLMLTYPASTGRNFDEILRVIDSLQLTDKHSVATPVNWKQGGDVIIVPSVSDEDAKKKFPGGWKTLKPYLRVVPQPK
jgi:alkyl hydroperoxide reductase subunit AhpC